MPFPLLPLIGSYLVGRSKEKEESKMVPEVGLEPTRPVKCAGF